MAESTGKRPWEQKLHEAATTVEDELRKVITYINDQVVPEVRQNGSVALRAAAAELEKLARKMDEHAGPQTGAAGPPPPAAGDANRS